MQDPRVFGAEKDSNPKLWKKKNSAPRVTTFQLDRNEEVPHLQGSLPLRTGKKVSKRNLKNEVPPLFQQPEQSNSDSLTDSYTSGNEYRALRKKYLLEAIWQLANACYTLSYNRR
ncbi:hypothetical protein SLEP1_g54405 [Rubroshorea leprosula]|uniref:Uncharacterized protein n=1 Tax=Rubroshorea leprosula TaxID=152421 RepID=A0AAV5MEB2_9ROSI|nr:hypothetical protein SLEP1_g54405 [Rubroshorea leprosula]